MKASEAREITKRAIKQEAEKEYILTAYDIAMLGKILRGVEELARHGKYNAIFENMLVKPSLHRHLIELGYAVSDCRGKDRVDTLVSWSNNDNES